MVSGQSASGIHTRQWRRRGVGQNAPCIPHEVHCPETSSRSSGVWLAQRVGRPQSCGGGARRQRCANSVQRPPTLCRRCARSSELRRRQGFSSTARGCCGGLAPRGARRYRRGDERTAGAPVCFGSSTLGAGGNSLLSRGSQGAEPLLALRSCACGSKVGGPTIFHAIWGVARLCGDA